MSEANVAVLSETVCHLGEGPTYDPATDTLYWFDIVERKLLEKCMSDGETVVHELPVMASALAVVDGDRQCLITETGLQIRDKASGALAILAEVEADRPETRSNDARVHPCGALWFSTMGKAAERKAGAIYWYFKGELRRLFPDISIPNAICFSADGRVAHFADTAKNLLFRMTCDPATGLPTGDPELFIDWRGKKGGLDGAVIDADGVLWNARWGAGALDAWSPAGELLRTIEIPARQPSCPAFVGADAGRIAVTSAWEGMDAAARDADPHAGKTFLVDVAVKGRFEPRMKIA